MYQGGGGAATAAHGASSLDTLTRALNALMSELAGSHSYTYGSPAGLACCWADAGMPRTDSRLARLRAFSAFLDELKPGAARAAARSASSALAPWPRPPRASSTQPLMVLRLPAHETPCV